ncbi:hypothetical protein ATZ36_04650 [Candidatus Endomicrobiellum trichonymphae]|uniref:Uncharacterized protein n=1 Tax=Endomicrobium trichonymphae TaxID=1408204 RepID=A0A1E5IIY6_ENDTX|nr:hypothetical protein ATZ36_04650 [Candidatus Endomicrobium trichonymphae]
MQRVIINETQTRAELIDPKLKDSGWIEENNCKIFRELVITSSKVGIQISQGLKADYVLSYKNVKLAVIEAEKSPSGQKFILLIWKQEKKN